MNGKTPRSLTLPEVRKLRGMDSDSMESEIQLLAWAFDVTTSEAEQYLNTTPAGQAIKTIGDVWRASGLGEDATKSGAQGDDARA